MDGIFGLWLDDRLVLRQLSSQAPLELLAQFADFHSRHHDELTSQHFARVIVIRQLASYATVLAILVPAKPAIRNRLRADELKTAQKRVPFRHLKFFPK